ncbi:LPS-assembly protein LptD [Terracidiphilus gabretensis]|uniref:LPS-assembly protein LptD n=1 Tax=Terracidiphilus gabretensis TaxID=1577687 RepID=UPI0009EAC243|nr:LPS assembly protein LptD [Terracidiphilus gabretensis]
MHLRNFLFITAIMLCHLQLTGQTLTNGLPPSPQPATQTGENQLLPDDPGLEALPLAKPEPVPAGGEPVSWIADRQTFGNKIATLYNVTEFRYKDYVLSADKVVYHQDTTDLEAEGHVRMVGGPGDLVLMADHGEMQLNTHTGRFYGVTGTIGVRSTGRSVVYSTVNPFVFTGRVLVQSGEGKYQIVDGTMTNCRLPKPDWQILSRQIRVEDEKATTKNAHLMLLGIPIFYLPWLQHPTDESGRESGFVNPVLPSNYNSIRGYTMGVQYYWAISRSMDMLIGSEYYSRRGFAPNGDFRYKGLGLDHVTARWNALLDRGVEELQTTGPQAGQTVLVNQGGVDIVALGRKDLSDDTRISGNVEYLSSYLYRLVFNDNYWLAIASQVKSDLAVTNEHNGLVASGEFYRMQNFASSTEGQEARILKLPSLRYEVLDRALGASPVYWGMDSSMAYLGRSEPGFHAHNEGRLDLYPHISMPIVAGGWSFVPEAAFRETFYTGSQTPDLAGVNGGIPFVNHQSLNRLDLEAGMDIRPPAVERDFSLGGGRVLRHVIEPELTYRYVGGIGVKTQDVLLFDTTDIASDTNEVGYSLTQRFYVKPPAGSVDKNCDETIEIDCTAHPREWASWQIAQRYYLDSNFGGAIINDRRNILEPTLDLTGIAFLTGARNLSPVISRMRFEAVPNLRLEWDLDYDPHAGKLTADNVFAGYSWGITTIGVGHSLLNAVDEQGATASTIQSQQINPFLEIGKQNRTGFNLAANAGYDIAQGSLQYAGILGVYNWNCCGISLGYRKFDLGPLRGDDVQYLYSFTFANFGSPGNVRHSTTIFRDATLPPAY